MDAAETDAEKKECNQILNRKNMWDEGIGEWCVTVNGRFDRADPLGDITFKWIKFCELPGGHIVRFWNSGDEDPPNQIGVRIYPSGGGEIDLGDLEKIGKEFPGITNALFTKESERFEMHSSPFSKNSMRGRLIPLKDNPHLRDQRKGAFRVTVDIKNYKKDMLGKETDLTPEQYERYHKLKPIERKLHETYQKHWEEYKEIPYDSPEKKKYDDIKEESFKKWIKVYNEIRDLFHAHKTEYGKDQWEKKIFSDGEWKMVTLQHLGGMEGSIYDFMVDLPGGPPPRQREKKPTLDTDSVTITPAVYSHLRKIDEHAWEDEMRMKPDAIDFTIIKGPYPGKAATLKELKDTGIKHIRVNFPSGRVEEYDLDEFI